jgi:hypothetical protein
MRPAILIAGASLAVGLGLAGCTSMPSMDFFKSTPPNVTVRLESVPPGADARTSIGPSCKTPCAVSVPLADNFSVSFTLDKYQPQTVQVQTVQQPGDYTNPTTIVTDPNPVYAELQPAAPLKRSVKRPPKKPAPKSAAVPAAAPAQDSAFPPPPPAR